MRRGTFFTTRSRAASFRPRRSTLDPGQTFCGGGAFGPLTVAPHSPAASEATVFDLASLTKVVATTSIVMEQVHRGVLRLDDRIEESFSEWGGIVREYM